MGVSLTNELTSIFSPIETLIVPDFCPADSRGLVMLCLARPSASVVAGGILRGLIDIVGLPSKTLQFLPF